MEDMPAKSTAYNSIRMWWA